MKTTRLISLLFIFSIGFYPAAAEEPEQRRPDPGLILREAVKAEDQGQIAEAFDLSLQISAAVSKAAELARRHPELVKPLVEEILANPDSKPESARELLGIPLELRARLVLGEIHLAAGEREEALAEFRACTKALTESKSEFYPVESKFVEGLVSQLGISRFGQIIDISLVSEPTENPITDQDIEALGVATDASGLSIARGGEIWQNATNFSGNAGFDQRIQIGPGIAIDNWLMRRFIALESDVDVAAEYARMLAIHEKPPVPDQYGYRFAIGYATFLNREKSDQRQAEILSMLSRFLRKTDLEPNSQGYLGGYFSGFGYHYGGEPLPSATAEEFIRIAYGFFKDADALDQLEALFTRLIDVNDHNPSRLVFSRIRDLQGQPDEAIKLHLSYLDEYQQLPEISRAIRRGKLYRERHRMEEAARSFEHALDLDEQTAPEAQILKDIHFRPDAQTAEIHRELIAIYRTLGRLADAFEIELQTQENYGLGNYDYHPAGLAALRQSALDADQLERFQNWALRLANRKPSPAKPGKISDLARAALLFHVGEFERAWEFVVNERSIVELRVIEHWRDAFENHKRGSGERLIREWAAARPENQALQIELMRLGDQKELTELIKFYEDFLASEPQRYQEPFTRSAPQLAEFNHAIVIDYGDLVYRLLRLYAKTGQIEKLQALGLRFASMEEPMGDEMIGSASDFGERAVSVLLEHADAETLEKFQAHLNKASARELNPGYRKRLDRIQAQLDFRLAGSVQGMLDRDQQLPTQIPWKNLPDNVEKIYVSLQNGQSICRNDRWVFIGQPWGVSVYDFDGQLLHSVLLGVTAKELIANEDVLWVGTPTGLRRIDLKTWEVANLTGHQTESKAGAPRWREVQFMAMQGDELWVSTSSALIRLNTKSMEMTLFDEGDLGQDERTRIWIDTDKSVWINTARFDPKTETWTSFQLANQAEIASDLQVYFEFLTKADGAYWARVRLRLEGGSDRHDTGDFVARIDPETGVATLVPYEPNLPEEVRQDMKHNVEFRGRIDGQLCFLHLVYNSDLDRLEMPKIDPELVEDEFGSLSRDQKIQASIADCPLPLRLRKFRHADGRWEGRYNQGFGINLPDGRAVYVRGKPFGSIGEWESPPFSRFQQEEPFGVFWRDSKEGEFRRLELPGLATDMVFASAAAAESESGEFWVTTSHGATLIRPDNDQIFNFDRRHGMARNYLPGILVRPSGEVLFRSVREKEWDSPLTVFNPNAGRFSLRFVGIDEIENVPIISRPTVEDRQPIDLLGGSLYSTRTEGDLTWISGSRGIVAFRAGAEKTMIAQTELEPKIQISQDRQHRMVAQKFRAPRPVEVKHLEKAEAGENPYILASLIRSSVRENDSLRPFFIRGLDPEQNAAVRSVSTTALAYGPHTPESADALQNLALVDPQPHIRLQAAQALAGWRVVFAADELIRDKYHSAEYLAIGTPSREALELLVSRFATDNLDAVNAVAKTLAERPEFAEILLEIRDTSRFSKQRQFVKKVFKKSGDLQFLPLALEALKSEDRVTRATGALVCGALGDPASVQPLIEAFDLESGFSHAAIVIALGEIGPAAKPAIPKLVEMFIELKNTPTTGDLSGQRFGQMVGANQQKQFSQTSLIDIGAELDGGKILSQDGRILPPPKPKNEQLLATGMIIGALAKIGPCPANQKFFREFAGSEGFFNSTDLRAMLGVFEGVTDPNEIALNIIALKSLSLNHTDEKADFDAIRKKLEAKK
ncbi:MAG: tetratricopeptide (TPR) repeat protein [Verrucomicrobiales bacterium]